MAASSSSSSSSFPAAICIWSSSNNKLLKSPNFFVSSHSRPHTFAVASRVSSSLSAKNHSYHHLKPIKASAEEGNLSELIEESKFVPLTPDDPAYGPPALLLLGFDVEEAGQIKDFLKAIGGDFLEVIFCTDGMINRPLLEAVSTKQPKFEAVKVAESIPRICFLSGLTGEEMIMLTDDFPETGLDPAVFAALVPNNADKPLSELIEEIMADNEMMTGNQSTQLSADEAVQY